MIFFLLLWDFVVIFLKLLHTTGIFIPTHNVTYTRPSHHTKTVIDECSNGLCARESENLLCHIMHTDKTIYALRRSRREKNDRTRFTTQNVLYCTTKCQLMMVCGYGSVG